MKKFLTILISAVLLVSLLPISAFADDDTDILKYLSAFGTTSTSDVKDANIDISYSLSEGESISAGKTNSITISIHNKGKIIFDAELSFTTPTGIVIESGSVKRGTGIILPGATEEYTFPITCSESITETSFPFTVSFTGKTSNVLSLTAVFTLIGVSSELIDQSFIDKLDFDDAQTVVNALMKYATSDVAASDTFYVPVKLPEGKLTYATPRIMLTNYNCGGSVLAGQDFGLSLTLRNTSKEDLYNIKVTLDTQLFIPVGSSNSYFIDEIKAGQSSAKTIVMNCPREVPQGQQKITVATSYEDIAGAPLSGTDTISIPVVQQTRLVIDDILDPGWLTMSDTGYANVTYRNMGNTAISNLTITVEGDFDMEGSNVYYVGNLSSNKSDSYSFSFYPREEGSCNGTVTFTYEDSEGLEHHIDKQFSFNIGPAYNWDDAGEDVPAVDVNPGLPKWAKIAIPVAALVVIAVGVKLIKIRKAKKQEALDLDE